ncbi:MAG: twin-arginine translocase subunit TatC [Kiritimatiellia bacterium]|nr:twin-arginine translocase subunit TatC [Kiritimatiellia bacterium]
MATDDPQLDPPKPFLQHLEELRRALLGSLAALIVGMGIAIPLAPRIFRWLQIPLQRATGDAEPFLRTLDVSGGFTLAMQVVFWSGLLLSLPAILFFIGAFVAPGLTARERRLAIHALFAATVLFIMGVILGYTLSLPVALTVMLKINEWMGVRAEWIVSSYVVFALQLLAAFGLVFELPVLLVVLGRLGLVTAAKLRTHRRLVIVLILIVAMILTPPDIFTQLIMAIPLIALYEICILIIGLSEKRKTTE